MDIPLVFFIYGLAFFSMGLALLLEVGRYPLLSETRLIIPLVIFGFIHGIHEWIEMFLDRPDWLAYEGSVFLFWLRIMLLSVSFSSLMFFGLSVLLPRRIGMGLGRPVLFVGILVFGVSIIVIASLLSKRHLDQYIHIDAFIRYFLGAFGSILTGAAFFSLGRRETARQRKSIGRSLYWAGMGFCLYAVTQTFVSQADFFPANLWNTDRWLNWIGIPIQIIRAGMAIWITIFILRMIYLSEVERAKHLVEAQKAKLDALERMQQELANREIMRQEFIRKIMVTQDEERARISRDLHDETAQILTAFSLNLAALRSKLDHDPDATKMVDYLQKLNQQISVGIYNLMKDLRPIQLGELGLGPAIQYLADQAHKHLGVRIHFELKGTARKLSSTVENALFRVSQEAINNIARHAGVAEANVLLEYSHDSVHMQIRDSGNGFIAKDDALEYEGLGIAGMRERVHSIGGIFTLTTEPGKGTLIDILSTEITGNENKLPIDAVGAD